MFKGLTIGAPHMAYEALDFYDVDSLLTEEELMVRDMVRDWVDEKVIPNIEQHYLDGTFPREWIQDMGEMGILGMVCLLYTSPSPRDAHESRMPSSA